MDGVIIVDKPAGWTSHDAVGKMRGLARTKKIGHLGTLDPNATGVLPLVLGRATRLAQFYMKNEKVYDATIHFGYATDSYDSEGAPQGPVMDREISGDELEPLLERFRGPIRQVPPPISAKKVGGTPAYRLARRHVAVDLKPVDVEIFEIRLVECRGAEARLYVHCSAGTYLRGIAHELGQMVGCGAFLDRLVRLRSGDFRIEEARSIDVLAGMAAAGQLHEAVVPMARMLPQFPSETVDSITAGQIRQGRDFRVSPFRANAGARYVKALSQDGALLAIGEARLANIYHPVLVL